MTTEHDQRAADAKLITCLIWLAVAAALGIVALDLFYWRP